MVRIKNKRKNNRQKTGCKKKKCLLFVSIFMFQSEFYREKNVEGLYKKARG